MEAIILDSSSCDFIAGQQMLSGLFSLPCVFESKEGNEWMQMCSASPYGKERNAYLSFEEFCRFQNSLDSTAVFRFVSKDDMANNKGLMKESPSTEEVASSVADNTKSNDINKENERFLSFLESRSQDFIQSLVWGDFEDGMENDITRQVSAYMRRNRFVTYCWLNKIFSDNRSKPIVTSGILRTLVMVVNRKDAGYMLPMVIGGLASKHTEDQEAAIMVIEKWRTKECLDAMLNTTYGSDWVKEYAMQVIEELREELEA